MKNLVLQSSIWIALPDDQLTFSLRSSNGRKAVHDFCCNFHIIWPSLWDGYPEISAHLKCNNMASLVEAKYHTVATIQEPIIRSEQFPCACVMVFSRTSLFLECLWREFLISGKLHKPVSKTYRPRNDSFCLLITFSFPFWYLIL